MYTQKDTRRVVSHSRSSQLRPSVSSHRDEPVMVVQLLRAFRWHMVNCVEPNLGRTWQQDWERRGSPRG